MYWITALVLLIYMVVVYLLGRWLPLHGWDVWILRGVLALLGLIGAGVAFWYQYKIKKAREAAAAEEGTEPAGTDDLDSLVREAVRRLKQSTLGRGTNLASLPLVFVLGESGSTKTSAIIHSALDPELLAGQVYRDNQVLPTSNVNIWYTRQALFVDPGGAMMSQPDRWKRLVKLVQPGRFSSAVGRRSQPPRAAIVCFDCENFMRPGASETAVSAARRLSVRLQEVSQMLGISFPVYVLFTRLDRISFFTDFVRGMSKDEAAEVLGVTLPLRSVNKGVYADDETRRLTTAFDSIFYSLAERRILFLPREHENDKLPGIYEFPRELNKLRTLLVQFLVDLARPSQLSTNPLLRGFYFTGVRPVVVDDVVAAAPAVMESQEPVFDAAATQIFSRAGSQVARAQVAAGGGGSRRVPQWVFLSGLFNDVLLKDRVAFATSGSSSRVNMLRRLALGAAVLIGLIFLTGFIVSFFRNHAMESRLRDAVEDLRTVQPVAGQVANVSDLQKLDRLREEVATLSDYQENGAPLSMRWGLYEGDQIYPDARRVYFERFRQLLFGETQGRLIENLRALPDKPGPNDVYETAYSELKAYLITTSNHDKSTKSFLSPVLMSQWSAGREIDSDRRNLASAQFDFYSTELAKENPYASSNFPTTVEHARAYLQQFAAIDRYYSGLLNGGDKNNPSVNFSRQFKDAADVVNNHYEVRGAFTKNGFLAVQQTLQQPSNIAAEEWVLGKSGAQSLDASRLQQELSQRYYKDFVATWNAMLNSTTIAGYNSMPDATVKLGKLAGPSSPLLELFWFVSQNTDVPEEQLKKAFQPIHFLEPPGGDGSKFVLPNNENYVGALTNMKSAITLLAASPNPKDENNPLITPTIQAATDGQKAVGQIAQKFQIDAVFHIETLTQKLLETPFIYAQRIVMPVPGASANSGGSTFCSGFGSIANKYPLRLDSPEDLSVDQLNKIFAPTTGDLWKFYNDSKLSTLLTKQGSVYVANTTSSAKVSQAFLSFFNRAARVSDALYPSGSPPPHFSYSLKQMPSNLDGVQLKIGNETLQGAGAQKTFVWTGVPEAIEVTSKGGDTLDSANGTWGVFRFLARAHQLGGGNLEWVIENNGKPVMLPNGRVKSYVYQLQAPGGNPFFDLQGLKCTSQVVVK